MGRLGLGLESQRHVVGRLGSGPRVEAGVISGGIFGMGLSPGELSACMGYLLESQQLDGRPF